MIKVKYFVVADAFTMCFCLRRSFTCVSRLRVTLTSQIALGTPHV